MEDGAEKQERLIFARFGPEVEAADLRLAFGILKKLGFRVELVNEEELKTLGKLLTPIQLEPEPQDTAESEAFRPKFSEITSPDDWVLREHFEDFREARPELRGKATIGLVFTRMIFDRHKDYDRWASQRGWSRYGDYCALNQQPTSPMPGIEVITDRTELGYPLYGGKYSISSFSAPVFCNAAIRAGSIVEASSIISELDRKPKGYEINVQAIATQLESQFK